MAGSGGSRGIHFNYTDLKKFERFAEIAGREFRQMDGQSIISGGLIDGIKEFVKNEIREALTTEAGQSHRFGIFMAERTQVEIVAHPNRFSIRVSGMSEHDLKKAGGNHRVSVNKEGQESEDINLWAIYEMGLFDKENYDPRNRSKKAQQKDVGGVLSIRTKSGNTKEFNGSYKGIISRIMTNIRMKLKMKLQEAVLHYTKAMVADGLGAAGEKANKAKVHAGTKKRIHGTKKVIGLNKLPNQMRQELAREHAKYEQALASMGIRPVYFKQGGVRQVRFQRISGGQFTSDIPTGMKERIIGVLR